MADAGIRRGIDLVTARNTGSYGSPVWSALTGVRDQTLGQERTEIDASTRGFSGFAAAVSGLIKLAPEWEQPYDESDANLVAIQAAFYSATVAGNTVEFAFSDGALGGTGIRYIRAVCCVLKVEDAQPLDGIDMVKVSVKPTYNANAPSVNTA